MGGRASLIGMSSRRSWCLSRMSAQIRKAQLDSDAASQVEARRGEASQVKRFGDFVVGPSS